MPAKKYGLRAYDEMILAPMVRLPYFWYSSLKGVVITCFLNYLLSASSNPGLLNLIESELARAVFLPT